jgi:hypothetical protein
MIELKRDQPLRAWSVGFACDIVCGAELVLSVTDTIEDMNTPERAMSIASGGARFKQWEVGERGVFCRDCTKVERKGAE